MSNRGSIICDPRGKGDMVAETATIIPLFWLSLLSTADIQAPKVPGQFEVTRTDAITRATSRLPLFIEAFEDFDDVEECCTMLIQQLQDADCETIGIEITELIPTDDDPIGIDISIAVKALEQGDVDCSVDVPGTTVQNPFTGESTAVPDRSYSGLSEVLCAVCLIQPDEIDPDDDEEFSDFFVGHRW